MNTNPGITVRGDGNIIRKNRVSGGAGAGLSVGGAEESSHTFGVYNQVRTLARGSLQHMDGILFHSVRLPGRCSAFISVVAHVLAQK